MSGAWRSLGVQVFDGVVGILLFTDVVDGHPCWRINSRELGLKGGTKQAIASMLAIQTGILHDDEVSLFIGELSANHVEKQIKLEAL